MKKGQNFQELSQSYLFFRVYEAQFEKYPQNYASFNPVCIIHIGKNVEEGDKYMTAILNGWYNPKWNAAFLHPLKSIEEDLFIYQIWGWSNHQNVLIGSGQLTLQEVQSADAKLITISIFTQSQNEKQTLQQSQVKQNQQTNNVEKIGQLLVKFKLFPTFSCTEIPIDTQKIYEEALKEQQINTSNVKQQNFTIIGGTQTILRIKPVFADLQKSYEPSQKNNFFVVIRIGQQEFKTNFASFYAKKPTWIQQFQYNQQQQSNNQQENLFMSIELWNFKNQNKNMLVGKGMILFDDLNLYKQNNQQKIGLSVSLYKQKKKHQNKSMQIGTLTLFFEQELMQQQYQQQGQMYMQQQPMMQMVQQPGVAFINLGGVGIGLGTNNVYYAQPQQIVYQQQQIQIQQQPQIIMQQQQPQQQMQSQSQDLYVKSSQDFSSTKQQQLNSSVLQQQQQPQQQQGYGLQQQMQYLQYQIPLTAGVCIQYQQLVPVQQLQIQQPPQQQVMQQQQQQQSYLSENKLNPIYYDDVAIGEPLDEKQFKSMFWDQQNTQEDLEVEAIPVQKQQKQQLIHDNAKIQGNVYPNYDYKDKAKKK